MQMYLVTIARLRVDGRPVPLAQLADALSISAVSVNEMCRKLQDHGLVIYRPYKGALLTTEGELRANHILRRHRLWEVFLVEKLGFAYSYSQAHDFACQLEHATPNLLADRLDVFLGYPAVNPNGDPVPRADGMLPARPLHPLTALSAGQTGHVVRFDVDDASRGFLEEHGVRPGQPLTMLAVSGDSVLLRVGGAAVSLARGLADSIRVEKKDERADRVEETPSLSESSMIEKEKSEMQVQAETRLTQIPLHDLPVGQRGIVVRVGGKGPSRRRMMDMGLVPGTEVEVVRVAPLGDPIEFTLKGYNLSLRKSEAKAIQVEVAN
jgi:DtxR family Mn-dependent transcriptional regulator